MIYFFHPVQVFSTYKTSKARALQQLPNLRGCQVHTTVMLSDIDRKIFKKLGVGLSCEPVKKR